MGGTSAKESNKKIVMKLILLLGFLGGCSADLLQYNYYAELNDLVVKAEHLSVTGYKLLSTTVRKGVDYIIPTPGQIAAEQATYGDKIDFEAGSNIAFMMDSAFLAALVGDCEHFDSYSTVFIANPFRGLYDKNFWCLKM